MFRDRFWVCLALTVPILYFAPLTQEWLGYRAVQFPGAEWVQALLATAIYVYGGLVFIKGAAHELRARAPGMMTLISLAITVAFVYSVAVTFGFKGMPLYWELATLVTIMLLGHWIEMSSVQGASRALEHLAALVPSRAHKLEGGTVTDVPVEQLKEGDRILIRPGEQVPVDGVVEEGSSSVNEAFLTGESRPVPKEPGDEVVAGSVNGEGALTVRVTRTGDDTTLSQIQRLVREAQASRSRFQNLADRAAGWLTYIAIGAGALTFLAWWASGEPLDFALTRAVAVLVIACPHALGLAIPLVTVNATSMAARAGILVRNREAFERARDLKIVAFDKTGTLTEGKFGVRRIYTAGLPEEEALRIGAALERRSEHPLARAVVELADQRNLQVPAAEDFRVVAGKGVIGSVGGKVYRIGRPEWIAELGLELPVALRRGLDEAEARGESVIALMDEQGALALFALADKVRGRAREAVHRLRQMGIQVVMITGDAEAVARSVASELGIQRYHARVLPEEKAKIVRQLKQEGPTAFVGDGINDAPALLEADLGVAIGAGTNVAIESADLVLIEDDPLDVAGALQVSRATYRKMVQNLFWATGYNTVALPLAAGVGAAWGLLLSPAMGAVFMSLSTVAVAVNAMLLRRLRLE
ncbi:heavy metal translocating P-type ATPase [Thermaerobacter subterraneus]|nr:heavy metal translocating P-type ATPase [Thermaerobacter subterraneus]